jgi:hypothetical protein
MASSHAGEAQVRCSMTRTYNTLVVTAASHEYAGLACELVHSLGGRQTRRSCNGRLTFVVLDLGLTKQDIGTFAHICSVVKPPVPSFLTNRDDFPHEFLMSRAVRAVLPDLFPNYCAYVWLDADTWVQRLSAVHAIIASAKEKGCAAVPSLHPSYSALFDRSSEHYWWMYGTMADVFGRRTAQQLQFLPVYNSGVFAADAKSPIWNTYERRLRAVFRSARVVDDQAAFNVAVYKDAVPVCALDATHNWLCCHRLPRINVARGTLTEPTAPFRDIGIVHLTARCAQVRVGLPSSSGDQCKLSLRYWSVQRFAKNCANR